MCVCVLLPRGAQKRRQEKEVSVTIADVPNVVLYRGNATEDEDEGEHHVRLVARRMRKPSNPPFPQVLYALRGDDCGWIRRRGCSWPRCLRRSNRGDGDDAQEGVAPAKAKPKSRWKMSAFWIPSELVEQVESAFQMYGVGDG